MRNSLAREELDRLGEAFLTARSEHLVDMPEDITKADLERQAANAGLGGVTVQAKPTSKRRCKRQLKT